MTLQIVPLIAVLVSSLLSSGFTLEKSVGFKKFKLLFSSVSCYSSLLAVLIAAAGLLLRKLTQPLPVDTARLSVVALTLDPQQGAGSVAPTFVPFCTVGILTVLL